jgi:non-ribosomal peptide synthase protein (TIGR01720 family)
MTWTYSQNRHQHSTIEALAHGYVESLRSLIDHCLSPEAGGYTPADFKGVDLSQSEFDDLMATINSALE